MSEVNHRSDVLWYGWQCRWSERSRHLRINCYMKRICKAQKNDTSPCTTA